MTRASLLAGCSLLLAACQAGSLRLEPLSVEATYTSSYAGSIAPLTTETDATLGDGETEAGSSSGDGVMVHATVVELPLHQARELVPGLVAGEPHAVEELTGGGQRRWSEERVVTHGETPMVVTKRTRTLGVGAGLVSTKSLASARVILSHREGTHRMSPAFVPIDGTASACAARETRFVKSLRLAAAADSILVEDIELGSFEHGSRLGLALHRDGDALRLDLEWTERAPVRQKVTDGVLEVPVLAQHLVKSSVPVVDSRGIVLASLPGETKGSAMLLFVELESRTQQLAAR